MILHTDTGSDRIRHMIAFLIFTKNKRHHTAIIHRKPQQIFEVFDIILKKFLKQDIINKTVFDDRNNRLHFFTDHQVFGSFFPFLVDQMHGTFHDCHDLGSVNRFVQVFQNAESDGFLCIIKFIIGRHHDKNRVAVRFPDLTHRLNSVDTRHLDIHDRNIRAEVLRQFDHTSAGLGGFNHARITKFF